MTTIRQTITTKSNGTRIIAETSSGIKHCRKTDDDIGIDENHFQAARELRDALGWTGGMICGEVDSGFVFVFSDGPRL